MPRLARTALLFSLVILPGCARGCGKADSTSERTRVTVSIFPVYDLVRRVAGPDADVSLLLQPGRSAHSFEPAPKDVETAARAKLAVMVGLDLDPWMEELMEDAAPKARILKVGDRVPTLTIRQDSSVAHEGKDDPHVWLDPQRAQLIVRAIAEELGRVDAAHALAYRERATQLDQSLAVLDKEAEERLSRLKRRGFVTFHHGFGYFAERYKLDILAVVEPVPGSPPTSEHRSKVLEILKHEKVPALFREPQLDSRPAEVLAEEAKMPLGVLDPIGGGPETDSYEKTIRFDVAELTKYLE